MSECSVVYYILQRDGTGQMGWERDEWDGMLWSGVERMGWDFTLCHEEVLSLQPMIPSTVYVLTFSPPWLGDAQKV